MENSQLASRLYRFISYTIDILATVALVAGIAYFFFGFDTTWANRNDGILAREKFIEQRAYIRNIAFLVWILFSWVMECSYYQGTFGKMFLRIKVVDEDGNSSP